MNKIGLIIKREYLRRVSKKSFLLLTFLTPFLFAALVFVPLWLSTFFGDEGVFFCVFKQRCVFACRIADRHLFAALVFVPLWL